MRKRSRFFYINIILVPVLVIALTVSLVFTFLKKQSYDAMIRRFVTDKVREGLSVGRRDWSQAYLDILDTYEGEYPLAYMEEAEASLIGEEYQGERALEGYQFYKVKVLVHNYGTKHLATEYISIGGEELEPGDYVMREYFSDDRDGFSSMEYQIIPAGQRGEIEIILSVSEGTESIGLHLSRDYTDTDVQTMKVLLP